MLDDTGGYSMTAMKAPFRCALHSVWASPFASNLGQVCTAEHVSMRRCESEVQDGDVTPTTTQRLLDLYGHIRDYIF